MRGVAALAVTVFAALGPVGTVAAATDGSAPYAGPTLQDTGVAFESPRGEYAVAWLDDAAYIFGGRDENGCLLDDILRFGAANGTLAQAGRLPEGLARAGAVAYTASRPLGQPTPEQYRLLVFGGLHGPAGACVDEALPMPAGGVSDRGVIHYYEPGQDVAVAQAVSTRQTAANPVRMGEILFVYPSIGSDQPAMVYQYDRTLSVPVADHLLDVFVHRRHDVAGALWHDAKGEAFIFNEEQDAQGAAGPTRQVVISDRPTKGWGELSFYAEAPRPYPGFSTSRMAWAFNQTRAFVVGADAGLLLEFDPANATLTESPLRLPPGWPWRHANIVYDAACQTTYFLPGLPDGAGDQGNILRLGDACMPTGAAVDGVPPPGVQGAGTGRDAGLPGGTNVLLGALPIGLTLLLAGATSVGVVVTSRRKAAARHATAGSATFSPSLWHAQTPLLELDQLKPGHVFLDRYRVQVELGRGASGTTFRCQDTVLGRPIALKVMRMRPGMARDSYIREARLAAGIAHANVVTVHDVGVQGEHAFLVMEYLANGSLAQQLAQATLPLPAWKSAARDLLRGLAAAHAAGIVHRDVKPSNLLRASDGALKVADFGVATDLDGNATLDPRAAGQTVGTAGYMSPEAARGRRPRASSDVYSAAAVLFEAAKGRPFLHRAPNASVAEALVAAAGAVGFRGPLPAAFAAWEPWFSKALQPDPAARFQDAAEALAAFEACALP